MGKPSISMGFENRTTCCMCPPSLSPPRPPSPESTRPPLDTRADSFPRERWLQTVPNVFPDIEQKYRPHAGRERICGEDVSREKRFEKYKRSCSFSCYNRHSGFLYINAAFRERNKLWLRAGTRAHRGYSRTIQ